MPWRYNWLFAILLSLFWRISSCSFPCDILNDCVCVYFLFNRVELNNNSCEKQKDYMLHRASVSKYNWKSNRMKTIELLPLHMHIVLSIEDNKKQHSIDWTATWSENVEKPRAESEKKGNRATKTMGGNAKPMKTWTIIMIRVKIRNPGIRIGWQLFKPIQIFAVVVDVDYFFFLSVVIRIESKN